MNDQDQNPRESAADELREMITTNDDRDGLHWDEETIAVFQHCLDSGNAELIEMAYWLSAVRLGDHMGDALEDVQRAVHELDKLLPKLLS